MQDWLVREVINCKPLENWWKEREKDEDGHAAAAPESNMQQTSCNAQRAAYTARCAHALRDAQHATRIEQRTNSDAH